MHVDDFMKMEVESGGGAAAEIGPTGMNPHLQKYREKVWNQKYGREVS